MECKATGTANLWAILNFVNASIIFLAFLEEASSILGSGALLYEFSCVDILVMT